MTNNDLFIASTFAFALIAAVALLIVFIVASPALTIWALNTLVPALTIPFTWKTYLASAFLLFLCANPLRIDIGKG